MPTNLPPEYFEADKRYRQASGTPEKITALEALISTVPKHKGTDKLRAGLRKRLSRLREEATRKKKTGGRDLFTVERQGAAQIALVGLPNSGKSSLLAAVTNAHPVIADYPMSTVLPLCGMMPFEDIQFQLVDLPPIGNESTDGPVSGILRITDILLVVIDLSDDPIAQAELLIDQVTAWKIPLRGGGVAWRGDRSEKPGKPLILVANKRDLPGAAVAVDALRSQWTDRFPLVAVSCKNGEGLEEMGRVVFENSQVIRVYAKEPGKEAEMDKPFTLAVGATVLELAGMIHKDFVTGLQYACIWGSARFDGQRVQRDYPLQDRDVVELHVK